nr:MAG: hypothetical protein [Bacteriophage sp.]
MIQWIPSRTVLNTVELLTASAILTKQSPSAAVMLKKPPASGDAALNTSPRTLPTAKSAFLPTFSTAKTPLNVRSILSAVSSLMLSFAVKLSIASAML